MWSDMFIVFKRFHCTLPYQVIRYDYIQIWDALEELLVNLLSATLPFLTYILA